MQDKKTLLRQKWIEALESGEYRQIIGSYSNDGGYCALGLGIRIAEKLGFNYHDNNSYDYSKFVDDTGVWHHFIAYDNDGERTKQLGFSDIAKKLKDGEYDVSG